MEPERKGRKGAKRGSIERATAAFYVFFSMVKVCRPGLPFTSSRENSVPERILSGSALSSCPRVRLIRRVNSPFKHRVTNRSHIISISKENSGLHIPHSVFNVSLPHWRSEDDRDRPRCRPNYLAERQPRHRQSLFASRLADESSIVRPPAARG